MIDRYADAPILSFAAENVQALCTDVSGIITLAVRAISRRREGPSGEKRFRECRAGQIQPAEIEGSRRPEQRIVIRMPLLNNKQAPKK